ncbi:hypothetical protein [Streptomyces umbrinus]|uniref:hypothetical protein n=1 Tax=Streptomyces umbrinus TaxID=67370 RepID=UPI0033D6061C
MNTNGVGLEVRRNGNALTDPHVLEIQLLNRGRRDITSSHFDAGQPIRLDVGLPIIELLTTTSEPTSLHPPTTVIDGTALKIGPSLLARRQTVTFAVLVEGHSTQPGFQAALQDVSVKASWDPARRQASSISGVTAVGGLITTAGGALGPAVIAMGGRSNAFWTAVAVLLAGLWASAGSWWAATTWARRR